jgi:tetratricopeptide (TPR) repeat protein
MNEHEAQQQRVWLLLRQGRVERAEEELRLILAEDPDSEFAHAQLALCLSQLDRNQEAHDEAKTAVGLAPGNPFAHFVHSVVLSQANCLPEAESAVREAINLDQSSALYFGQLAKVHLLRQRWPEALAAAEKGLEIDPADDECANLRSIALIRLGRRVEATDTLRGALERDPGDAWTHANLGWSLIEEARYDDAMPHFREALRLEPNLEHARLGIITALKAQHFLYRPLLRYFLWAQKLNDKFAVFLMIGAFLLFRLLSGVAQQNPGLAPFIIPVLIAYVIFAVSSWLGNPLFNLVLFTNRFGRLALSNEEKWTSWLVAGTLSVSLTLLIASAWFPICLIASLGMLLATLPLSKVFDAQPGKSRWAVAAMGATVGVMSLFPVALVAGVSVYPALFPAIVIGPSVQFARFCVDNLGIVAIGSQLISQALVIRRPRQISL